jgi:peptidoglycan/LPS O-acetylase OafA/YrhL
MNEQQKKFFREAWLSSTVVFALIAAIVVFDDGVLDAPKGVVYCLVVVIVSLCLRAFSKQEALKRDF